MTIEEVIAILAERDSPEMLAALVDSKRFDLLVNKEALGTIVPAESAELNAIHFKRPFLPIAYTASRDALDPILHKLVERERNKLLDILCDQIADGTTGDPDLWELVAMPPYKLATAIAEAIVACRKETKNERGNGEP